MDYLLERVYIDMITVKCYNEIETWKSREEAKEFYLEGAMMCEGSEQARYWSIYNQLCAGLNYCTDEE